MEQTIINRIRKLLALAGDQANVHEAEAAILKAQALMAEYGVDPHSIESAPQKKIVYQDLFGQKTRINRADQSLAVVLGNNFRCVVFRKGDSRRLMVFGLEQDVQILTSLLDFVLPAMHRLANEYALSRKKTDPHAPHGRFLKNSFMFGFRDGLKRKFAEQVKQNNWGLVLVKDPVVTEEEIRLDLKPGRSFTYQTDPHAKHSGYDMGRSFLLGTPVTAPKPELPSNC